MFFVLLCGVDDYGVYEDTIESVHFKTFLVLFVCRVDDYGAKVYADTIESVRYEMFSCLFSL